ncbi:MAG TPA: hypothetical protein VMF67_10385 [Rhizomicrobium sp.]|nr:hypothetical protein [Rhizomicrobium sp.]
MQSARLIIRSEASFPTWTFSHYLSVFEANYLKLIQIYLVIDLLNKGARDDQFIVTAYSAELYPTEPIQFRDESRLVVLAEKGKSAREFWQQIRRRHRPLVFYLENSKRRKPLYSLGSKFALRIPKASVASPIEINAKGAAEVLHELRYGSAEEARAAQRHELDMEEKRIKLARERIQATREFITLIEALNSANITENMKKEIVDLVRETTESQAESNRKLTANIKLEFGESSYDTD